ncbi:UDP:flavonoid glycosyltransferase YjiC (YdhE family) [Mycolicibacterium sp. BK556]|uniref:glycosyltransferase n=1 Tax=unclassified Mycolicibacterium TaxID=2636767 RepID=UPI00160A3281|nr:MULTISPECIES: glycosyltransferase [unclassified Mycolicibacterium]MBB3606939.1 UDP:flavonoid glycosyltransferase YjiC (YdhE family) [Mycolicibacterium sp. BK556]MBB3636696.1 UDP:flavonoid glycosyltransferase YjiC (YdhE family) [Mycolicibacterium sp. BK607]
MKIVLANWGSRGEVEPFAVLGRELVRRGHDVHLVVAPDLVEFASSAGPTAVAYGPTVQAIIEPHQEYFALLFSKPWRLKELGRLVHEFADPIDEGREAAGKTLMAVADGADLLVTGMNYEGIVANVAEYCHIPLATLQHFPLRVNGRLLPVLPAPFGRAVMRISEWLTWRGHRANDDAQRRDLGLPKSTGHWTRRIAERGSMEIQAYDAVCFPGLADEWSSWNAQSPPRRPFVGALTLEMPADDDSDVKSWIAEGTPPIFFGFGSMPMESANDTIAMIAGACATLGERALIGAGVADFSGVPEFGHVKVVGTINYAEVFPACRAIVHHGGSGTTNAGLRSGRPTMILWRLPDQLFWAGRLKRLKVGTGRRFLAATEKSLVADLRKILAPDYVGRARRLAAKMTKPADSVAATADLVEAYARAPFVGRTQAERG